MPLLPDLIKWAALFVDESPEGSGSDTFRHQVTIEDIEDENNIRSSSR